MTAPEFKMALDIRSVLKRPLSELRGFTHPCGRPMTPREAQTALLDELSRGRELLPIGRSHVFTIKSST